MKTSGAIKRHELIEQQENARKIAKQRRKTERLVCIYRAPFTMYPIREGETLDECRARFDRTHGKPIIAMIKNDVIPIRWQK